VSSPNLVQIGPGPLQNSDIRIWASPLKPTKIGLIGNNSDAHFPTVFIWQTGASWGLVVGRIWKSTFGQIQDERHWIKVQKAASVFYPNVHYHSFRFEI